MSTSPEASRVPQASPHPLAPAAWEKGPEDSFALRDLHSVRDNFSERLHPRGQSFTQRNQYFRSSVSWTGARKQNPPARPY